MCIALIHITVANDFMSEKQKMLEICYLVNYVSYEAT